MRRSIIYKLPLTAIATLGALSALLIMLSALLIAEPQWFLTTRTVTRAAQVFGSSYHPRWKTLVFDIRSLSFPEKQVHIKAQDFCFGNPAVKVEGCLKSFDVRFNVRLYFFGAKLTKLYSLEVSGDHLNLDRTGNKLTAPLKKSGGLPVSLPNLIPEVLRGLEIGSLQVDMPGNKIVLNGGTLRGRFRMSMSSSMPGPLLLKLEFERSSGTITRHYRGEASLASDILKGMPMTHLDASGSLKAEGVNAGFKARVEQNGPGALAYSLSASAKVPAWRAEADMLGSQKGQDLTFRGSAGIRDSTGPVKSVRLKDCVLAVRLKADSTEWDTVKFAANFEVEPEAFRVRKINRSLARTLEGRLAFSARSTPEALAGDHFDAEVSAVIKPVKDWYEFYGGAEAKISGRAGRVRELKLSHKFALGLKVEKFEDLVAFLAHTPYSIPAPVNVLRGPLGVTLKGGGDSRSAVQELDYTVVSGLAADRQALRFKASGKVTSVGLWAPGRSFRDDTDLTLQDIALQLPRVDIKGAAALTPDSRIRTGRETDKIKLAREEEGLSPAKSSVPSMQAEVRVKTAKPAILYSNLAMDPVPLELALTLRAPSGGIEGTVDVGKFRANIFRRTASIEYVKITGRAGSPVMNLDGLILYRAAEAKISIRLLGTTQKPRVQFESNPPMSQADIVAMLLFGKSPEQLDSDQQSSAANAQTAAANSAFGLASLYLLASTPVEYVGYDPASRTYTVKFRLPGGATLQMGSDDQSRGVQLRKRISSHLAVQTELTSTQTQGDIVTTLLEWYGRR
ncbi:MAG: hypothetical protein A2X28_07935 [Elusimicrobia bacterium GWA2_56_46]|nr:MAG: hypothetical protein A2X28_07935 [Elusimicrobia bacterium GWA2_56_46]OGR54314.1 MAG: hypothetical protein A2X39_03775 [Elusimicrobia bacterium GWC2_56_31]HBB66551.1 hypothetical protein [Elusimicrobiota bacterium]HBW22399.1 hypothetical protein [Elusimicrobiota bacterium]